MSGYDPNDDQVDGAGDDEEGGFFQAEPEEEVPGSPANALSRNWNEEFQLLLQRSLADSGAGQAELDRSLRLKQLCHGAGGWNVFDYWLADSSVAQTLLRRPRRSAASSSRSYSRQRSPFRPVLLKSAEWPVAKSISTIRSSSSWP